MSEFQRISLREALESAVTARRATMQAFTQLSEFGATEVTSALAQATQDLDDALNQLRFADERIQRKASALPEAPTAP